jgi:hypothetical protein
MARTVASYWADQMKVFTPNFMGILYILLHTKHSGLSQAGVPTGNIGIGGIVCSFKRIVTLRRMLVEIF